MLDDNHFKLSEISLKVRNQEHDTVEKDCSCDSEYMLSAMNRVGEAICQSFHWVPIDELVYLFIDGAGGHGTKEAIFEYKDNLQENFNIQLAHTPLNIKHRSFIPYLHTPLPNRTT